MTGLLDAMPSLYVVPAWVLLVLAVALAAAAACGGLYFVRRAFPEVDFRAHNDVGGIVVGIVGGLFAVTVAFIVALVWQEFDQTTQRVSIEAAAATDLWHTSSGLPQPIRRTVRTGLRAYARAMVDDEWKAMRSGGSSARAEAVLTAVFEDVARFRPRDGGASNAQAASLQHLADLHDARHHRLEDNRSGVDPFEWTILMIGAIAVIAFCYLVGLQDLRVQYVMTGVAAAVIASMFVLIFELDYPFRGDLSVTPAPWHEFLDANTSTL